MRSLITWFLLCGLVVSGCGHIAGYSYREMPFVDFVETLPGTAHADSDDAFADKRRVVTQREHLKVESAFSHWCHAFPSPRDTVPAPTVLSDLKRGAHLLKRAWRPVAVTACIADGRVRGVIAKLSDGSYAFYRDEHLDRLKSAVAADAAMRREAQAKTEAALLARRTEEAERARIAEEDAARRRAHEAARLAAEHDAAAREAEARRQAAKREEEARRQAARREEEARRQAAQLRAQAFQRTLKVGDMSHCGLVIEVRPPVVKVQTMVGEYWFKVPKLYAANDAPCAFVNRIYREP